MESRAVLFVDDEEMVLKALEKSLKNEVYYKYFAKSGIEALEILKREEVHVIIVDMIMPEMDGIELLKIVKEKYPHIVSMVLSGYAQPVNVMIAMNELDVYRFISKPWSFDEDLISVIRRAIDHYDLQVEHQKMVEELRHCSG